MDVLIKGMKMPTSCCQCPVNMDICKRGYKYLLEHPELYDKRADDCPIIPVPPHGELIERDKLREKEFIHDGDAYAVVMSRDIRNAPTIIPAEEAEEDKT